MGSQGSIGFSEMMTSRLSRVYAGRDYTRDNEIDVGIFAMLKPR